MTQSEFQLEKKLIAQLQTLGYEKVSISNAKELKANLKLQLEKHNQDRIKGRTLSETEFKRVLNTLSKGNVFDRSTLLHESIIGVQGDDGKTFYLELLQREHWCQNRFQVTHQISQEGKRKNRYDVTLLINGLPLVQIELKRRGMELKEAFNQINRYQRESFWAESGLFQFVQLFVISNGVNTRYFANNRHQDYKQTFTWSDANNKAINNLEDFAQIFLEKCHLSKMICQYIVRHQTDKILMVLRPYQYYAAEEIFKKVKDSTHNGYIWHTTGSGKTLTSFKTAQRLCSLPRDKVNKIMFVVDRADLDYQTIKEFNAFSSDCVDQTEHTSSLVEQMTGDNRLIVTTIQKLNRAITVSQYKDELGILRTQPIVFIFDECHRSQFGEAHMNIKKFFEKRQMFGFTGTPIFKQNTLGNTLGKRTTDDLFDSCLHKYLLPHAIDDQNVLKFSIEYWGKIKRKDGSVIEEQEVAAKIDRIEFYEHEDRIENIVDWIIAHHDQKNHQRDFSAMLCVGSVQALHKYYDTFRRKKQAGQHDLRVATIFTAVPNEEDEEANGEVGEPSFDVPSSPDNRDKLASYVDDYNQMFNTKYKVNDSSSFYTYYKGLSQRMKDRSRKDFNQHQDRLDILLVVNMFLTGFDAKKINTLYVDKNLKHHGLIQAFSRTNRTIGQKKSQGNIVCFRGLKKATDEAIALFSNEDNTGKLLVESYDVYVNQLNKAVKKLKDIAATPEEVDDLQGEEAQLKYILAFRDVSRVLNTLRSFIEFTFDDVDVTEQTFNDYKSKYLDLYEKTQSDTGDKTTSIINDVDFELELIHTDTINVTYILKLLAMYKQKQSSQDPKEQKEAKDAYERAKKLLTQESQLRSKKELIENFIEQHMDKLTPDLNLDEVFDAYWQTEKNKKLEQICQDENLDPKIFRQLLVNYEYSQTLPLRDELVQAMHCKPKLTQRKSVYNRLIQKIKAFVETFDEGLG
jgi:type I restriction enzyme R subunit